MSNLNTVVEKAANRFAEEIIAAIKDATLQELLAIGATEVAAPGRKRGRPPKAKPGPKPGRKPGRPRKVTENRAAKKKTAKKKAKRKAK